MATARTRRSKLEQKASRNEGTVRELSLDEGMRLFDQEAQRYLGISGEEFIRKWKVGDYANDDRSAVIRVAMLLPFAE